MSTRRALLEEIFRRLDERQIPICVQRNYANLFDETTSDVDLLTLPEQAASVIATCEAAAATVQHRLVQRTRFVNHSLVFWNGGEGFVRIDVDTEKRWQRIHLLTAAEILARRRRWGTFDVPDPRHECVIVLAQLLWRGKLSERYRARLRELDAEIADKASLVADFDAAFGVRENLLARVHDPNFPAWLRRAVRRNGYLQLARGARSLRHICTDAARLLTRFRSPPGILLRSMGVSDTDLNELRGRLAILFPLEKGFANAGASATTALRKTLFKGGMAIESWPATDRPALVVRRPWLDPHRGFVALREPDGTAHFAHAASGTMRSARELSDSLANFICATLARQLENKVAASKGLFVVLVGLDGSGKTTLARNLVTRFTSDKRFAGIRYRHWLPSARATIEFPLPESGNQPRHRQGRRGFLASLLSAMRLLKNVVRARLGWWLQVRPLLRRGYLVLVDRYFYNYHLDPASVRFSAPKGLLKVMGELFPAPDVVVKLHAPREVLLARKQELTPQEIERQIDLLQSLDVGTARVVTADATLPADQVARLVMAEITNANLLR